ncbi:PREDICTED: uncharacterized protein LOC109191859 [Ipomoea nil]|uniref:uncharacterized protein LOC109191859 n=1 Tax=Ipomoea nil TaxID=35883 RepID=UPI000901E038|nr:PREDICTED: uncharacterized protein LOC109191859 [Ipomoea nil]
MTGGRYTWVKGRGTDDWVEERLDRAVATLPWIELHEEAVVRNIYTQQSDHCAILIDVHAAYTRVAIRRFRFESAWLLEEGCTRVVDTAWRMSMGLSFPERLAVCSERLGRWGGDHHRKFGVRSNKLRRTLDQLKEDRTPAAVNLFFKAERELEAIMKAEELFWKQRSKQLWLKHGDANTKFFHKSATARRKQNFLSHLKDQNGVWAEGLTMKAEIIRYFEQIFCSGTCRANIFNRVTRRVTEEMKISLSRPFTVDDVKTALFDMQPEKAPGPDSLSPAFFQHFWPILGHDLSVFIINCVEHKQFPQGLNDSNIVLIPKKSVPEKVSDLRPIALCKVVYKVLAKMLANRLKGCLDNVVSQSQSAFIPNRLLTDNIILAGEVGHYLRRKTGGCQGWVALKLDMAKAYDRMEWPFLKGMLEALGFQRDWVDLLMLCVTTVNYSILVNGEIAGQVRPTRGIRQGDPLSPYLFILCAEGLSILLQQAEARGDIHGVRVARGAPAITHLFFADDSLLFFRAKEGEALKIKDCLDVYSLASGQLINYEKSTAVFSHNTSTPIRNLVSGIIGVPEALDLGRYLGLPSALGRSKTAVFKYIEGNVRTRMGAWHNKLLSRAGKEVLLKSIAQSLPIFTMSVYLLPLRVCDTLEKLFNRFWWGGGNTGNRGIHWLSWEKMCTPKAKGGLGFKKLHQFNTALLAKQGWRLLIQPESLVSRTMKAKYFPTTGFMEAQLGGNPSFIWRSILAGRNVLQLGIARRVGDGRDTKVWGWNWVAGSSNLQLATPCVDYLREARVQNLMTEDGNWDTDIIYDIFLPEYVPKILATPVNSQLQDCWRWVGDIHGCYTVKHGYRLLMENQLPNSCSDGFQAWQALWALSIPPKVKNFLWRCARGILPVRENLHKRRAWIGGGCPLCGCNAETMNHLFCDCGFAQQLWSHADIRQGREFLQFMAESIGGTSTHSGIRLAATLWTIWLIRNEVVWQNRTSTSAVAIERVRNMQRTWEGVFVKNGTVQVSARPLVDWTPPLRGTLKCNTDAAVSGDGAGFASVIRDHEGHFVAAMSGRLMGEGDPFMAEVLGAKEALTWLKSQSQNNFILESDCLNFCNAFNSCLSDFSYVGLVVKQCQSIARDIGNVTVSHVKRSANRVAHELARATVSMSVSGVWSGVPPDCIAHLF